MHPLKGIRAEIRKFLAVGGKVRVGRPALPVAGGEDGHKDLTELQTKAERSWELGQRGKRQLSWF